MTQPNETQQFPGSEAYSERYYGVGQEQPIANYTNYRAESMPHWARPLAYWLKEHSEPPYLDVGAAYGHLCRELERLGLEAQAVEWSEYAHGNRVTDSLKRADARQLPFPPDHFNTVVSLDLLEHFTPEDTQRVIAEMVRVAKPGATFVHVIGAHNPADDLARHLEDPTHANHEPLEWYIEQFSMHYIQLDRALTDSIKDVPAWSDTDWRDRILVFR